MEIRCEHKKHCELIDGILEVKCSSRFCGAGDGVVVIHRWQSSNGDRLEDRRFRDPMVIRRQEGAARL